MGLKFNAFNNPVNAVIDKHNEPGKKTLICTLHHFIRSVI